MDTTQHTTPNGDSAPQEREAQPMLTLSLKIETTLSVGKIMTADKLAAALSTPIHEVRDALEEMLVAGSVSRQTPRLNIAGREIDLEFWMLGAFPGLDQFLSAYERAQAAEGRMLARAMNGFTQLRKRLSDRRAQQAAADGGEGDEGSGSGGRGVRLNTPPAETIYIKRAARAGRRS